jgi:hypothetical protein
MCTSRKLAYRGGQSKSKEAHRFISLATSIACRTVLVTFQFRLPTRVTWVLCSCVRLRLVVEIDFWVCDHRILILSIRAPAAIKEEAMR